MKNIKNFWLERCTNRYGDNLQILQTIQTTEIYQYCDTMLNHMPKYALETFKRLFFTIEKCLNYQLTKKIEDCDLVLKINLKNALAKK